MPSARTDSTFSRTRRRNLPCNCACRVSSTIAGRRISCSSSRKFQSQTGSRESTRFLRLPGKYTTKPENIKYKSPGAEERPVLALWQGGSQRRARDANREEKGGKGERGSDAKQVEGVRIVVGKEDFQIASGISGGCHAEQSRAIAGLCVYRNVIKLAHANRLAPRHIQFHQIVIVQINNQQIAVERVDRQPARHVQRLPLKNGDAFACRGRSEERRVG